MTIIDRSQLENTILSLNTTLETQLATVPPSARRFYINAALLRINTANNWHEIHALISEFQEKQGAADESILLCASLKKGYEYLYTKLNDRSEPSSAKLDILESANHYQLFKAPAQYLLNTRTMRALRLNVSSKFMQRLSELDSIFRDYSDQHRYRTLTPS